MHLVYNQRMNKRIFFILLSLLLASLACNLPRAAATPTVTAAPTVTHTPLPTDTPRPTATQTPSPIPPPTDTATPVPSDTPLPTETPTPSATPTITPTPTETATPTASPSPTFSFPSVTVKSQSHCRYGPAKAHLHAADLYVGDTGTVRGRFQMSGWLYIKFDKLDYFCWVAPSVVDVMGDITTVLYANVNLPGPSVLYNPPDDVSATRNGDLVTITWSKVEMTEDDDRGYFLDLMVCQDGHYIWWPVALPTDQDTTYEVTDQAGCPLPSSGKLYAVEKHGYTNPVEIAWPAP
jgi:hypothetical protein